MQGWLIAKANWAQRVLLFAAGSMLILTFTNSSYGIAGLVLLLAILIWQGAVQKVWDWARSAPKGRAKSEEGPG